MKVFISWSGDRAKHIAQSLKEWLPYVLQAVKPWMSDTDIESGQKWQQELSKLLDECRFGIVCVTPENQAKPWLNFEAGALSKSLGSATFVCPYIYEMEPEGLTGPLSQFQSRKADKEGTKQLIVNVNNTMDENNRLNQSQVEVIFDRWWAELDERFSKCPETKKETPRRSQEELLTEILENTRSIRRDLIPIEQEIPSLRIPESYLNYIRARKALGDPVYFGWDKYLEKLEYSGREAQEAQKPTEK